MRRARLGTKKKLSIFFCDPGHGSLVLDKRVTTREKSHLTEELEQQRLLGLLATLLFLLAIGTRQLHLLDKEVACHLKIGELGSNRAEPFIIALELNWN